MPVPDPWILPTRQHDHPTRGVLPDATIHARREATFLALAAIVVVSAAVLPLAAGAIDLARLGLELSLVLPLGVLAFPIGLHAVAIACELFGRRRAGALVLAATLAIAASLGLAAAGDGELGLSLSLAAGFVVAHVANWLLFDALRRRMSGRRLWLRATLATLFAQIGSWAVFAFVLYADAVGHGATDAEAATLVTAIAGGGCAYTVAFALVALAPGVSIARALATYTRVGRFIDDVRAPRPAVMTAPRPIAPPMPVPMPVPPAAQIAQHHPLRPAPVPTRAERRSAQGSAQGFNSMEMRFFTEGDTLGPESSGAGLTSPSDSQS